MEFSILSGKQQTFLLRVLDETKDKQKLEISGKKPRAVTKPQQESSFISILTKWVNFNIFLGKVFFVHDF